MVSFIMIVVAICFFMGIYMISLDLLKIPTKKMNKTMLQVFEQNNKKVSFIELFITETSTKLSKFIKLSEYRRNKLESTLYSAKINLSPEMYISKAILKSLMILILLVPTQLILPIISPIVIIIAILKYFSEMQGLQEIVKKNREEIEYELPRFASTISQEINYTRDVVKILDNYSTSVSGVFREELKITVADMYTGNIQKALLNMEKRVNSTTLSEISRGLIGIVNGDDNVYYFQMLSYNLKKIEELRLEGEALKRPEKINKYSKLLLVGFFSIFGVVIAMQLVESMSKLFQ